jgi:hypothetical protein
MNHVPGLVLNAVMFSWFISPYLALPMVLSVIYLPDVHVGMDFDNTRDVKSLAYHEIAHASHFTYVGANYWFQLALAEALAWGWGDQNSTDGGRIAICESWAEYLAWHMFAMRFNLPFILTEVLEEIRNENENHVPIGVHWDLQDFPMDVTVACDVEEGQGWTRCDEIRDDVSNLTVAQLFQILTSDVTSPQIYRDRVISVYNQNAVLVNMLFDDYLDTQQ